MKPPTPEHTPARPLADPATGEGTASTPSQPEPGWYPDPWHQASWRYWDGTWTDHVSTDAPASAAPDKAGTAASTRYFTGGRVAAMILLSVLSVGYLALSPLVLFASLMNSDAGPEAGKVGMQVLGIWVFGGIGVLGLSWALTLLWRAKPRPQSDEADAGALVAEESAASPPDSLPVVPFEAVLPDAPASLDPPAAAAALDPAAATDSTAPLVATEQPSAPVRAGVPGRRPPFGPLRIILAALWALVSLPVLLGVGFNLILTALVLLGGHPDEYWAGMVVLCVLILTVLGAGWALLLFLGRPRHPLADALAHEPELPATAQSTAQATAQPTAPPMPQVTVVEATATDATEPARAPGEQPPAR